MNKKILVPGTAENVRSEVCSALEAAGYSPIFMGSVTNQDIVTGQGYIDNDICVAALAAIGQTISYMRSNEGAFSALSLEICKDCRSACLEGLLPDALKRAGIGECDVVPFTCAELSSSLSSRAVQTYDQDKPVIGVCGNTPILSTPLFAEAVTEHLKASGIQIVEPPLNLIVNDQDFLEPAIAWFEEQGIESVICILAFGCLGGHVFARGKARKLREKYPHVELTLLDYDPSASEINVVNRTELVIQSAKERLQA